jgi:hypothetical protein
MALDAELSLPVVNKHKFSLGRMHTVAGYTCHRLTVARIYRILSERMGDLMLLRMASCTRQDTVRPEIKRVIGMGRYMALKTLSISYGSTSDDFQSLFHKGCLFLGNFMAFET